MEKTLVYHLYLCDDIEINMAYKINLECLKYFIDVFDKVKFIVVMDNLSNFELRNKGINWINNIGFTKDMDIIFRKNTNIGEAATVRDYVINLDINKNDMVFFAHSKGISNFNSENINKESIFNWIITMYFYNLYFIDEVENIFMGKGCPMDVFYGTLLMVDCKTRELPIMIPKTHYSGSFYWVNKPLLLKLAESKKLKDYVFSTRYDAEFYPGYNFNYNSFGAGMASHNNISLKLDNILGTFYGMDEKSWNAVFSILGNVDEFYKYKERIKEKIIF